MATTLLTWRCGSCGGLYLDPQSSGARYYHVCPRVVAPDGRRVTVRPNARDETIVQDVRGGPARPRAPGAGRALLARADLLSGATPGELTALFTQAPIGPVPSPEDPPYEDLRLGFPAPAE